MSNNLLKSISALENEIIEQDRINIALFNKCTDVLRTKHWLSVPRRIVIKFLVQFKRFCNHFSKIKRADLIKHSLGIEQKGQRLCQLGIENDIYQSLIQISKFSPYQYYSDLASWQLAKFHTQHANEKHAEAALIWLNRIKSKQYFSAFRQQYILLKSLNYYQLERTIQAQKLLLDSLKKGFDPNYLLALSNIDSNASDKDSYINYVLKHYHLTPIKIDRVNKTINSFDEDEIVKDKQCLTIIIPALTINEQLKQTLGAIQRQVWYNFELLLILKNDQDWSLIQDFIDDDRTHVIAVQPTTTEAQAKNQALLKAKGEFVTVIKPGHWIHPNRLSIQVRQLQHDSKMIANFTQTINLDSNGDFKMAENGLFVYDDVSTTMFRREIIKDRHSCWKDKTSEEDQVFIDQLRALNGSDSVVPIESGPVTINIYPDQINRLTQRNIDIASDSVNYLMKNQRSYYDVLIIADFSDPTLNTNAIINEIKWNIEAGLKTGILSYSMDVNIKLSRELEKLLENSQVEYINSSDYICAHVVIVKNSQLTHDMNMKPLTLNIKARATKLVFDINIWKYPDSKLLKHYLLNNIRMMGNDIKCFGVDQESKDFLIHQGKDYFRRLKISDQLWYNTREFYLSQIKAHLL